MDRIKELERILLEKFFIDVRGASIEEANKRMNQIVPMLVENERSEDIAIMVEYQVLREIYDYVGR